MIDKSFNIVKPSYYPENAWKEIKKIQLSNLLMSVFSDIVLKSETPEDTTYLVNIHKHESITDAFGPLYTPEFHLTFELSPVERIPVYQCVLKPYMRKWKLWERIKFVFTNKLS